MKIAGLAIVGILITLMIITGAQRLVSAVTGPTASQIAADLARADRIRADSALYATWAPISAALLNVGAYVVTLGLFVYLGALGAAHVRRNWYERRPDNRGLLPVLASDQSTARAALASFHMARIEESRRPLVPMSPATFTYSPHVTGALAAPVTELWIGGDASGALAGHQLTAIPSPAQERRTRAGEAVRQVRAAQGHEAMLRVVEIEPWSRLPERRWALTPYEP